MPSVGIGRVVGSLMALATGLAGWPQALSQALRPRVITLGRPAFPVVQKVAPPASAVAVARPVPAVLHPDEVTRAAAVEIAAPPLALDQTSFAGQVLSSTTGRGVPAVHLTLLHDGTVFTVA